MADGPENGKQNRGAVVSTAGGVGEGEAARSSMAAERRAVVGSLAAELGHDLQGPLNLFRLTSDRIERGDSFDREYAASLREELTRLSELTVRLKELARSALRKTACSPAALVEHALTSSGRVTAAELELALPGAPLVRCDATLLALALMELIHNAHSAKRERAGVRFSTGNRVGFCVWDDGPGFALDFKKALAWGATSDAGSAGLGLTVALRGARAHGFALEMERSGSLTELWIVVPARDLVASADELSP